MDMEKLKHKRTLMASKSPWGPDDEIGRLNWITSESREQVMKSIDITRTFDLTVEYFNGMPSWSGAGIHLPNMDDSHTDWK